MIGRCGILYEVVSNYAGVSCMIMSIIGGMHHRYIYINNGMARYTLSIRMDKRNRTCIESSIRLLEIQDYLCEWLNTRYGYSYGLLSVALDCQ